MTTTMEPTILDTSLSALTTIDTFESLIWKDIFCGYGDIDLLIPASSGVIPYLAKNYYISLPESEHLMIINHLEIKSDAESINKVIVKGLGIESILDWRVVWQDTILTGDFQDAILLLLNENAINPTDTDRKITLLEFEASTDPVITDLTIDTQIPAGYSLYKAILELCVSVGIGFQMTLSEENKFVFKLYAGVDRSYSQEVNPYVVFSPDNENLSNSNYVTTNDSLKTVTLISAKGDGEVMLRFTVEAPGGAGTDLDRREMFTDATGLTKDTPNEEVMDDAEYLTESNALAEDYIAQIQQKGIEDLSKSVDVETFEGEVDPVSTLYVFGEDFFMGDLVEVADDYGHNGRYQVAEFIRSEDGTGLKIYPTFVAMP